MFAAWDEGTGKSLVLNIGVALSIGFLANLLIFLINPAEMSTASEKYRFDPPGWVIGLVWTFLFSGLGVARWLVIENGGRPIKSSSWVFSLLLFCAAYPLYMLGLRSVVVGLIGNVATGMFALWVGHRIRRKSFTAALLVSAVAVWVTFASFLTVQQLRGRSF